MEDRDRVGGLVGHKVAVRLINVEARRGDARDALRGTRRRHRALRERRARSGTDDVLPWDSLKRVRERPPWLRPPHEEPGPEEAPLEQEFYELREATAEEVAPEPPDEHRRASRRETWIGWCPSPSALEFDEEAGEEVVEDSYDGPWIFRFSI